MHAEALTLPVDIAFLKIAVVDIDTNTHTHTPRNPAIELARQTRGEVMSSYRALKIHRNMQFRAAPRHPQPQYRPLPRERQRKWGIKRTRRKDREKEKDRQMKARKNSASYTITR